MNVLIVDDIPSNQKLLRAVLEADSHHVLEAADGLEALEIMDREKVDVVISDILMPRMDGYRLCYEVRAKKQFSGLPFIFYTATYTSASDEKLAFDMGGDKFLTKPAHASDILRAIQESVAVMRLPFKPAELSEDLNRMKEYNQQLVSKLEERNAELALRQEELMVSERSYRRLFEAAKDGILILDVGSGRIVKANPFIATLLGLSQEEMVGKTVGELSPFKDIESNQLMLEKLQRQGFVRYEDLPLEATDGRKVEVEFVSNVYEVGHKEVIQCNIRDITERKKSDQKLKLLSSCVARLNDVVLICEADNLDEPGPTVVFVNDAFERVTGYKSAEILGRSPRFLQGEKTDPHVLAEIRQALELRLPIRRQLINYKKDGTEYWMDIDIVPIFDGAGHCTHFAAIERDITEAKEIESQLRWKTAFFEAQVNSALDGIIIVDSEGKKLLENQKMAELWDPPQEILDDVDHRRRLKWVGHQVRDPQVFTDKVAYLYTHPDAISRDELELINGKFFDRYTAPVIGQEGSYFGRIWAYRDITERKQSEAARRASEARYRTLFDCAPDGILIGNPEGYYLDGNASMCRMLGYTLDEMIGLHASDIVVQEDVPRIAPTLNAIRTNTDYQREWQFRRKDGSIFAVEVVASAMPDGNMLGMVRDLSDRKRAEEKLIEQAALLDEAQDAIFVRNLDHCMTYWNKGAERLYGWTLEETIGRNVCDRIYPHPEKLAEINDLILKRGGWHGEMQNRTKDKRDITVEARFTLIRNKQGLPSSILAIITDTTEKKKMETQFMRAQRMESIGTLAGGIAHDLNNILAPIMMSIELLKDMSADPRAADILKTIDVSARRGADIVRQVLSFSRGMEGERIEVQAAHLLKDLEIIIKDTFPKDIRLQFFIPSDIWTIFGDPTQVHQIILNLCVNARDAMPDGGSLTISLENTMLDEQYVAMNSNAQPGRYVQISVADSGTGMPPELIERIFEPFFTTKGINKGTGLGLSTVMAIVKSHGGIVNVYSELGKGTTFKIYLPATENPSERHDKLAQLVNLPRGNGETILLIDDEASILTITSQTLEAFGYQVLTATDGADAVGIYALHRQAIAVVLTDMAMPIMDGAATVHALRRVNPAIKIIAASGLDANGGMTKGPKVNVKHFLAKPYTAETLLRTLRMVLDEA